MAKYERNRSVLALLAEKWPACFSIYEQRRRRPLKIGIHHDIIAALDGAVTAKSLSAALRRYVSNAVYRRRLRAGALRFDRDGRPAGAVPADQVPAKKPVATKAAEKPAAKSRPVSAAKPATTMPASDAAIAAIKLPAASRGPAATTPAKPAIEKPAAAAVKQPAAMPASAAGPARISLADLREAAPRRREGVTG
jgi:sRNA-binding protein